VFFSVNTAVRRGWKASASLLVLPTSAAASSHNSAMVSVLHPVWDRTAAVSTATTSTTVSTASSSLLDREVRYFGALK
jgi:hypothetical protein